MKGKLINSWTLLALFLVFVIIAGSLFVRARNDRYLPIEIYVEPGPSWAGQVYVGGEVNIPGLYPLRDEDTVADFIRAAGGATDNADPDLLELYVPGLTGEEPCQKVDINRAEAWLLEALPGIGAGRAQAIIAFREKNGPFRNTVELVRVEGIGNATYERIKDLVTVCDR